MLADRRLLAATAALSLGVPAGALAWVHARTSAVAAHLGAASGVAAHIGGVDADLTGRVRLTDVALGPVLAADAIEASVGLESLLAGQLGADEIRVEGPRIAIDVDATGDSDLARLVRRLAKPSAGARHGGPATAVRRIVVSSGSLIAHIAGLGELSADGVELVPDAGGVRVITGALHVRGGAGPVRAELELARGAAEITLPHVTVGRVLAVAGTGTIRSPAGELALRDLSIGRLAPDGPLELRAALDDGGVTRPIAAEVIAPARLVVRGERVPLRAFTVIAPHGVDLDDAHATGALTIVRDGATVRLAVDGRVDRVRVAHHIIGEQPLELAGTLRGNAELAADSIAFDRVAIDIGAAHWSLAGWIKRGPPSAGQLDVALAPAPCAELLASLPAPLRGPLDGMAMTGTFGGSAHVAVDLSAPVGNGVALATELANHCEVTAEPPAADAAALALPGDETFADGSHAKIGKGTPSWVELRHLPAHVAAAFVSAEDARFYQHHGFDAAQIAKSFEIDLRDHRLARGGSTISQQLVKNAFLTQRRTLDRKLQEAILTWRLEARLPKSTILERYLNIIELGPHVFGIGAAASYWFGVPARELTVMQAAFLAALTSEPHTMGRRVRHAGGLDPDSRARVDVILYAMVRDGALASLDGVRDTPLRFAATALRGDD